MATMNNHQEGMYERALARARAEGIELVGESHGMGRSCYLIHNPTNDRSYTVTHRDGAGLMGCTCEGAEHGWYCKHRAWTRFILETRAADYRAAAAKYARQSAKTSPKLRDDQRKVSMFK